MFAEFFLPYLKPSLERFGLSHFGCCEPVHDWLPHLKTIYNLRRVSISAWADVKKCAEQMRGDYVFSYKPNPTSICTGVMDDGYILSELSRALSIIKDHGCIAEVIMKDLHTIRHEPEQIGDGCRSPGRR